MKLDTEKIDEAVLALLLLGLHDGGRAWKGFDWEALNRLHEKGFLLDPREKAKSIVFTEEGLQQAKEFLETLFSANSASASRSPAGQRIRNRAIRPRYAVTGDVLYGKRNCEHRSYR